MQLLCILFVASAFLKCYGTIIKDLPPHFPKCKRYDPELSQCLLKATETVKPFLIKGVPELDISSIEPLQIPQVSLQQGTQALNFKATLSNIKVFGLSSYKFSKFDFDVPNLQWLCKCTIAALQVEGNYEVTGKILLAPIDGKGTFTAEIDHTNITTHQKVETFQKNDQTYLRPIFTNTSMDVGGPQATLEGLFGGNQELNKLTNTVIKENIHILFEDFKPIVEEAITDIMENLLFKSIEGNVPFDVLYLEK